MSKTIIVTGGAGFIGSNFVFHMLDKYPEYRIVCLDKLTYAGNLSTLEPVMKNPNFRFVKADICDRDAGSTCYYDCFTHFYLSPQSIFYLFICKSYASTSRYLPSNTSFRYCPY